MSGVRAVVEAFLSLQNTQGLLGAPRGWNFFDWVSDLTGIWRAARR
jgi:hypothetical protein